MVRTRPEVLRGVRHGRHDARRRRGREAQPRLWAAASWLGRCTAWARAWCSWCGLGRPVNANPGVQHASFARRLRVVLPGRRGRQEQGQGPVPAPPETNSWGYLAPWLGGGAGGPPGVPPQGLEPPGSFSPRMSQVVGNFSGSQGSHTPLRQEQVPAVTTFVHISERGYGTWPGIFFPGHETFRVLLWTYRSGAPCPDVEARCGKVGYRDSGIAVERRNGCRGLDGKTARPPLCGDRLGTSCTCRAILHLSTGPRGGARVCDGEDRVGKAYCEKEGQYFGCSELSQSPNGAL